MSDELYQELLLEHAKSPRNARSIADALSTEEHNILCGDAVTVYVQLRDNKIVDISCVAHGCVLSKASASLLTETLKDLSVEQALQVIESVQRSATGEHTAEDRTALPEELKVLAGVAQYPARVKCVTMVWHAAKKLLMSEPAAVPPQNHAA
ncbi:MAG: SUF system NifU family Fe-S cluster assembly protein [Candidatus Andersenbacteria bacterium]